MDIGSLLLVLSLFLLVAWFVLRPLFEQASVAVSQEEHDESSLLAERDRVLTTLQELDFDYVLGKIPPEDYPAQRAALLQHGADVLRQLESAGQLSENGAQPSAEDHIEAAIAARQEARRAAAPEAALRTVADDPLEAAIAARRRARQEKSAGFCPRCGVPVQKSDRFCPKCGAKLA